VSPPRTTTRRATLLALLAIALLIAAQPLGVLWHFVEDHHDGHPHGADDVVALHTPDADAPHHEADHGHLWMPPAASVVALRVSQPQPLAALRPLGDLPPASAAPFPPFSPPRA
jgi:hypothetical protein